MAQNLKQALILLLKLAFAGGLIFWFIQKGVLDLSAISSLLKPTPALILIAIAFGQIFINNWRWVILLRAQQLTTTISHTMPLSLIGMFFNYVMPGGIGGDVVKGYYLMQDRPSQKTPILVSMFMDRVTGFCVMVFTAALAIAYHAEQVQTNHSFRALAAGVIFMAFVFAIFYSFALSKNIHRSVLRQRLLTIIPFHKTIESIYTQLHAYTNEKPALLKSFGLSVLSQALVILSVVFIGRWMGEGRLTLMDYACLAPLGTIATALPISPAGIGVGQAAFYFLFNLYLGEISSLGPTVATALQLSSFFWGLVGALFYLRRKGPIDVSKG